MESTPSPPEPSPKRRWRVRYSLRMLLVVVSVLGIALGYMGSVWHRAQHQRKIAAAVEAAGGDVRYHYQFGLGAELDAPQPRVLRTIFSETEDGRVRRTRITPEGRMTEVETPPGPKFVRRLLGDDIFAHVEEVNFFYLPRLFRSESLGEFDPQLLLQLPELKVLSLAEHQVTDEWLEYVARIPQLRVLLLMGDSEGTATGKSVASLTACRDLEGLGFSGEWVRDETVAGIANLRQLKSLQFLDCPNMSSAILPHVQDLTELRDLTIIYAEGIDDRGTEHLRRLQKLQKLHLHKTPISDAALVHVAELSDLEWLILSWTNVGDSGMEHVARLSRLQDLNLNSTGVGDAGLDSISRLPELRTLDLSGTKVTDAGLPTLGRMTQLERLQLSRTSISDEGILHLATLTNLQELSIGPHITLEGADKLRAALPSCEVRRVDQSGGSSFPDR